MFDLWKNLQQESLTGKNPKMKFAVVPAASTLSFQPGVFHACSWTVRWLQPCSGWQRLVHFWPRKGSRGNAYSSRCLIWRPRRADNIRNGEILAFNAWLWTALQLLRYFCHPFLPSAAFFLLRLLDHLWDTDNQLRCIFTMSITMIFWI